MRQPHLEGIYVMESLNGNLVVLSFKLVNLTSLWLPYAMIFQTLHPRSDCPANSAKPCMVTPSSSPKENYSPKIENQWLVQMYFLLKSSLFRGRSLVFGGVPQHLHLLWKKVDLRPFHGFSAKLKKWTHGPRDFKSRCIQQILQTILGRQAGWWLNQPISKIFL